MTSKRLLIVLALLACHWLRAQNSDVIAYINTYKELAVREMQRSGVPAAITLAQGIHESMAGKSELVLKSNNHFGIKCRETWTGEKVYHDDDAEQECFRSYPSPADSYSDHSDFLKNSTRYASLFKLDPTKYREWAYGLKKAGYATNNRYPEILIKYIEDYNLEQYTLIALGKLQPEDEVLVGGGRPIGSQATIISTTSTPTVATTTIVREEKPVKQWPSGEFSINNTKVIFAKSGASLLAIANQYSIPLRRLLDFNDMKEEDVLIEDQLVFLARKRKTGDREFHEVVRGETLYDICQEEGIRMENLVEFNHLQGQPMAAPGEKLYLQSKAPGRPRAVTDVTDVPYQKSMGMTNNIANPSLTTHVVQGKETLVSIARKYGISVEKLREWNNLNNNEVKMGQELVVYKN